MSEVHNFFKNLSHLKILSTIEKNNNNKLKKNSCIGDLALGFLAPPDISSQDNYPVSTKIYYFFFFCVKHITKTTEYFTNTRTGEKVSVLQF